MGKVPGVGNPYRDLERRLEKLEAASFVLTGSERPFRNAQALAALGPGVLAVLTGGRLQLGTTAGTYDHGGLLGLADDDHAQYALLAGRSSGQTLNGGSSGSGALTLQNNATDGSYIRINADKYIEIAGDSTPTTPIWFTLPISANGYAGVFNLRDCNIICSKSDRSDDTVIRCDRFATGTDTPKGSLDIRSTTIGWILQKEQTANPGTTTELADPNDGIAIYNKANKLVIAYNNAGTMTYVTLPLDGSSTTWSHSTSAP